MTYRKINTSNVKPELDFEQIRNNPAKFKNHAPMPEDDVKTLMNYVGKFVVIDGGMAEYDEPQRFIETLYLQNEIDDKPIIKAWFITHPHIDHFNLMIKAVSDYSDKFVLEKVIYNFSDSKYTSTKSDLSEFNKIIEVIGKDKIIIARTGQKYVFGSDYLEIVYCADDFYPNFAYINDTSLVIKGIFNGKSIMWLADVEKYGSDMIADEYLASYLKSDIMQVGHHGFGGASVKGF